jgi:hypothetical protein
MMQIVQDGLHDNHMWLLKGLHVLANKANSMCKMQMNANDIKNIAYESNIQGGVDEHGPHEIMKNNTIFIWHKGRSKILHVG